MPNSLFFSYFIIADHRLIPAVLLVQLIGFSIRINKVIIIIIIIIIITKKVAIFHWEKPQETTFEQLKNLCCEAPVLEYYDVNKDVTIQCDASQCAVGAVLLPEGRPVVYASRKLRPSEQNWASIDKEMLAIAFSAQKCREYILGKSGVVQTDHKPLENILHKPLANGSIRLQAMFLKVSGYDLQVEYLPCKKQFLADTLSRASLNEAPPEDDELQVSMLERIY